MIRTVLAVLSAMCLAAGVGAAPMTYYDDGDPVYNNGVIDLGGAGRPASGSSYDGSTYLTVWGDSERDLCRDPSRVSAFVANDVGLDHSSDWYISMDMANDLVSPDIGFTLWLVAWKPGAWALNRSWDLISGETTFVLFDGDQFAGDNSREGLHIWAYTADGNRPDVLPGPRLDPDPDVTGMRTGHNYVTIQWLAAQQKYTWTVSNLNGSRTVDVLASQLRRSDLTTTWFVAGAFNNNMWVATGWTINSLTYAQGIVPEPGSLAALGVGLAGLTGLVRRRRRR